MATLSLSLSLSLSLRLGLTPTPALTLTLTRWRGCAARRSSRSPRTPRSPSPCRTPPRAPARTLGCASFEFHFGSTFVEHYGAVRKPHLVVYLLSLIKSKKHLAPKTIVQLKPETDLKAPRLGHLAGVSPLLRPPASVSILDLYLDRVVILGRLIAEVMPPVCIPPSHACKRPELVQQNVEHWHLRAWHCPSRHMPHH